MKRILLLSTAVAVLAGCEITPTTLGQSVTNTGTGQTRTAPEGQTASAAEAAMSGDTAVAAAGEEAVEGEEGEGGEGEGGEGEAGEGQAANCDVPPGGVLLQSIAKQLGCS